MNNFTIFENKLFLQSIMNYYMITIYSEIDVIIVANTPSI